MKTGHQMACDEVACFAFKASENGVVCSFNMMALCYPLLLALI